MLPDSRKFSKQEARVFAREVWRKSLQSTSFLEKTRGHVQTFVLRHMSREGRIFAWWSMGDEFPLLALLLKEKPELPVYLPGILENHEMEFRRYSLNDPLCQGRYGIYEPCASARAVRETIQSRDLVFIPSMAMNPAGFRLGRGGGFYDRWKERLEPGYRVTILPRDLSRLNFQEEKHDLRMNAVITENGLVDNVDELE